MPRIAPFRPFRYNPARNADLGAVIAPPYDVVTPERRRQLLDADPHNVIQLILPEGETGYEDAASMLASWIDRAVLVREPGPALYAYTQVFTHPFGGALTERRGVIAALALSPFESGEVLPHERTLKGPKADRLALMRSTRANLEAIFGVYRDPSAASSSRLEAIVEGPPIVDVEDSDGVRHRLWRVDDPAAIAAFESDLAAGPVFIVDGHHRYETALNYQRLMREQEAAEGDGAERKTSASAPYDSIMIFLAPTSDPGLLILPTHRVVHSLEAFSMESLLESLGEAFAIERRHDRAAALEALASEPGPAYLLASRDGIWFARLRPEIDPARLVGGDVPAALTGLDVTILHDYILDRLLGVSAEAQAEQRNLDYVKSAADAFDAAAAERTQFVVLMNPTRMEQVEAVAESGSVMPQKSTYFYPKLASGLLFNPLWE